MSIYRGVSHESCLCCVHAPLLRVSILLIMGHVKFRVSEVLLGTFRIVGFEHGLPPMFSDEGDILCEKHVRQFPPHLPFPGPRHLSRI